jgi:hypothetical protein
VGFEVAAPLAVGVVVADRGEELLLIGDPDIAASGISGLGRFHKFRLEFTKSRCLRDVKKNPDEP